MCLDTYVKKGFASTSGVVRKLVFKRSLFHPKMCLELAVLLAAIPSAFDMVVTVLALRTGCS